MNSGSEILSWDSNYFGFGVASITREKCSFEELTGILNGLKNKNIRLVYWPSDPEDNASRKAAERAGGFLADRKTIFYRALQDFMETPDGNSSLISEYQQDTPTDELVNLGILSGKYSRYKIDTNFTNNQFEGLYKLWVINSVNKKAADIVFVSYLNDKITAMVTAQKKGDTGIIGLIAVDSVMQGKNLGTLLVNKTLAWSKQQGCSSARVVTQLENKAACRLYEKCGYTIEKIQNFYHFWL